MGAIMLGTGYSAILLNIIRAICLLAIPAEREFMSSMVYFIISSMIMAFSAVMHIKFQKMPFVRYHLEKASLNKSISILNET